MTRASMLPLALVALACSPPAEPRPTPPEVQPEAPSEPPPEAQPPRTPQAAEVRLVSRSRSMMGTVFSVSVAGMPEPEAAAAISLALDEIARLEQILSEWREDSEIGRINAAAGRTQPITVGPDTLRVVEAGVEVSRWSEGSFDLSWAALRGLYLFQPGEERVPPLREVRARLRLVDYRQILVDHDARTVRLGREGMAIGTGGIAKGYAMDRAGEVLEEHGVTQYMIYGGGQVQVHGMRGDRPWRVGIQHPRVAEQYIGFLEATDGSISTSGDYEHAFVDAEGAHWHHILDTSTGLPARRSVQVTVLAPEGIYADALSTACFVLGPERCLAMMARIPGRPEAIILDPELKVWTTPGTRERVVWRLQLDTQDRLPGPRAFQPR